MEEEIISKKLTRFVDPLLKMDIDPEKFIHIVLSSAKLKYSVWIIDSFINGGIKQIEDIPSRVSPALEDFEKLKIRGIISGEEADINRYCGLVGCTKKFPKEGLEDLLDRYRDKLGTSTIIDKGKSEEIYNGETVRIIYPEDMQSACYYGQGTRWCTSARVEGNMFEEYNNIGPLYIILPKNPEYVGEKYQLQFETGSYMNELDEPVDLEWLLDTYEELQTSPIGIKAVSILAGEPNIEDKFSKRWLLSGQLHRIGGPARIEYDKDGAVIEEFWYKEGKLDREDGPSLIEIMKDKISRSWYRDGELHRDGGPAKELRDEKVVLEEEWWKNGINWNPDGPSFIQRYENGNLAREEWKDEEGEYNRQGEAAIITYFEDGNFESKEWYTHGKRDRDYGPALVRFYHNGKKMEETWYLDGHRGRLSDGPIYIERNKKGQVTKLYYQKGDEIERGLENVSLLHE